jgi:protein-S-isoprenylcysteine O-methyltransferase Ste14
MYAALLLWTLVIVLNAFSLMRLCIWFVLMGDSAVKLLVEERLLAQKFQEYDTYKLRTKRLIPFIY